MLRCILLQRPTTFFFQQSLSSWSSSTPIPFLYRCNNAMLNHDSEALIYKKGVIHASLVSSHLMLYNVYVCGRHYFSVCKSLTLLNNRLLWGFGKAYTLRLGALGLDLYFFFFLAVVVVVRSSNDFLNHGCKVDGNASDIHF